MINTFGDYFREIRIRNDFTLRGFCERYGFDPANISRLETNKVKPPTKDRLNVLAEALSLEKGSKERLTFFDLAYKSRNELPEDVKKEAPEVISLLPAFLRTKDGTKVSRDKLEKLISFLENDGGGK